MESLFEKFDSQYQVQQLAEEFYDVMDRDAEAKELRNLHPDNLFFTKKILYRFLVHWSGGPEIFNGELTNYDQDLINAIHSGKFLTLYMDTNIIHLFHYIASGWASSGWASSENERKTRL